MSGLELFQLFVSVVVGIVVLGGIPWAVAVERRLTRLVTLAESAPHSDDIAVMKTQVHSLQRRVDNIEKSLEN